MRLMEYSFYLFASLILGAVARVGFNLSANISLFVMVFSFISIAFSSRIYLFFYSLFNDKKVIYNEEDDYYNLYKITYGLSKYLEINMPEIVLTDSVEICAIEGDKSKSMLLVNPDKIPNFCFLDYVGIISHELAHVKLDHTKFLAIMRIPFFYLNYSLQIIQFILQSVITPIMLIIPLVNYLWMIFQYIYLVTFELVSKLNNEIWLFLSNLYMYFIEPQADKFTHSMGNGWYLISALEKLDTGIEEAKILNLLNPHKSPRKRIITLLNYENNNTNLVNPFNVYSAYDGISLFKKEDCALNERLLTKNINSSSLSYLETNTNEVAVF